MRTADGPVGFVAAAFCAAGGRSSNGRLLIATKLAAFAESISAVVRTSENAS